MSIYITYDIYDTSIDNSFLKNKDIQLLCLIEGDLTITIDSYIFFNEKYINILELAVSLHKWAHATDILVDYIFTSIDHDEPILSFAHANDTKTMWDIDSIWKTEGLIQPARVLHSDIISSVDDFLNKINIELYNRYGISIEDFTKLNNL